MDNFLGLTDLTKQKDACIGSPIGKAQDLVHKGSKTEDLNLKDRELVNVCKLCRDPTYFINFVAEKDERLIITKNGVPLIGLVPTWMLALLEKYVPTEEEENNMRITSGTGSFKNIGKLVQKKPSIRLRVKKFISSIPWPSTLLIIFCIAVWLVAFCQ